MSGRWIKRKRARSEWGRELAKRRWAKHRAEVDRKIREGEIPEPPKEWPLDEPYFEIVVTHRPTGRVHRFALYRPARGRRDQYRITHNGREWKAAMGLTRFFRGLQAAMFGRSDAADGGREGTGLRRRRGLGLCALRSGAFFSVRWLLPHPEFTGTRRSRR